MVKPYKKPITSMGALPTYFAEGEGLSGALGHEICRRAHVKSLGPNGVRNFNIVIYQKTSRCLRIEALSLLGGMGEFSVGVQDLPAVSQWQFSVGFQAIANKTGAEIVCRQGNLDIAEAEQEPR